MPSGKIEAEQVFMEAHRLIRKIHAYKKRLEEEENPSIPLPERAAAKRASLDLTAILAAWRKNGCP